MAKFLGKRDKGYFHVWEFEDKELKTVARLKKAIRTIAKENTLSFVEFVSVPPGKSIKAFFSVDE